ncbi:hypothetical protein EIN_034620 [Entamoeba invadens IP1]|uniref:Protein kinase domain-containing protein n=1 Tax=Entamoeba invadens IP1 TaxID=370355 RepID=A0A0A1U4A2_ENTIV|nr:hypothetical protein EIN_034620 [Entamoeba invadens IP1]ELP86521.1 hypothetical protein EIN_034620 [Entamoeba invadens IP1]|eukprot:XP_004185867.1 hypothetical protein EIN_034620 [Entamoeba invadens IP1]
MWSFGCMAAELFVGIPIFPGNSEYNMIYKFINMIGLPPTSLLNKGTKTTKFFRRKRAIEMKNSDDVWAFKTKREFEEDNNVYTEPNREYFSYKTLEDIAMKVNFRVSASDEPRKAEMRHAFLDFIQRALQWDPEVRMRPDQALQHPFITKKPFVVDYVLPPSAEPLRSFPPGTQLTVDQVLQKIAPNPAAAAKLRSMGYNATTYYQVYSDGLNKGIVLNILNSNPFMLQPMTPPSLVRANLYEEELHKQEQRKVQPESRGFVYQGISSSAIHQNVMKSQMKFKTFTELKKEKETRSDEMKERKQRRQTSDIFCTKGMESLSPQDTEPVAQSLKIDTQQSFLGRSMDANDINIQQSEDDPTVGSWSKKTGMLLPPGNF